MATNSPMDELDIPMSPEGDVPTIQEAPANEAGGLSFSGNTTESVADFIQSVQKHAFEQDRSTDDRWIAGYVGTCFSNEAMLWYSNLDDKTRNSWNKLRKALVTRYRTQPQPQPNALSSISPWLQNVGQLQAMGIGQLQSVQAGRLQVLQPAQQAVARERAPDELRGRVEVFIPEMNLWLGFIGYTFQLAGANLSISGSKLGAALVSFVPDPEGKPVQLRIENVPSDLHHPYVGLALDDPRLKVQERRFMTPAAAYYASQTGLPYNPGSQTALFAQLAHQMPPAVQNAYLRQNESTSPTWSLKPCTESSQYDRYRRAAKTANLWEKASAAVWTYDVNTKELGVTWMRDDGSEEQLAVSVTRLESLVGNTQIVLHRAQDNAGEPLNPGQAITSQNISVKLFFASAD